MRSWKPARQPCVGVSMPGRGLFGLFCFLRRSMFWDACPCFHLFFNMCLVFRFFGLNLRSKAQDISVGFLVAFDIPARTAEAEALEATAAAFRGSGDKAWNWQRWCKMVQMCWMQMPWSCILLLRTDFGIVVLLQTEMSCNDWRWCQKGHIVLSYITYHHYCHFIMPATPATGPLPRAMPCTPATGHRTRRHFLSYYIDLCLVHVSYTNIHTLYIIYINNTLQIS